MTGTSVYDETVLNQQLVSAPDISAWVAANAGAGKTKVLTDRVMRLLLSGTEPSRILCITFTKAAAAEMSDRLFTRLGEWALMEDAKLADALKELEPEQVQARESLSRARKLFARALETPGGLKIQTIHSFCEGLLRRFPLEAGVPPGFRVLEESEADRNRHEIINELVTGMVDEDLIAGFLELSRQLDEGTIRKEIFSLSQRSPEILDAVKTAGGSSAYWQRFAGLLGIDLEPVLDDRIDQFFHSLDETWLHVAAQALAQGSKKDVTNSAELENLISSVEDHRLSSAASFFLTRAGTPKAKLATAAAEKLLPGIQEQLAEYQELFVKLGNEINGHKIFRCSATFVELSLRVAERLAAFKNAHAFLDFDDLIRGTINLFRRVSSAWVLYKLDQGIDHVLLDEAQDTSDLQWQVIWEPLREFFSGDGAREQCRTAFVVGDEKQSIYSFQGAEVSLFSGKQGELNALVTAAKEEFISRSLTLSFRSVSPVLEFVDEVFVDPEAVSGVCESEMRHYSNRKKAAGLVEIWPLVSPDPTENGNPWDAPVDMPAPRNPARILARHIAETVDGWLKSGELLESQSRPIHASDILILCQRRGPVFHEIVNALTRLGVPTSGADRIRLKEHAAVKDMIAALRFCLQAEDDLSLAEILKSPLFDFSDDDLFELAWERAKQQSVWQALSCAATETTPEHAKAKYQYAHRVLSDAQRRGHREGPFSMYSALLNDGEPSGWRRMFARFGAGVREILDEFMNEVLAYERSNGASLQGFLTYVEQLDVDLKKENEKNTSLVRVMTVHGSKGLESNIIFLADAAYENLGKINPPHLTLHEQDSEGYFREAKGFIARCGSKALDIASTAASRERSIQLAGEEYRRLFYVAMTRARDRLYICGQLPGNRNLEKLLEKPPREATWYALAHAAAQRLQEKGRIEQGSELPWGGNALRLTSPQLEDVEAKMPASAGQLAPPPDCLRQQADEEVSRKKIRPSRLEEESEEGDGIYAPGAGAYSPLPGGPEKIGIYTRGNAIHLLLEKLPDISVDQRPYHAQRLLERHYPDIGSDLIGEWAQEALSILDHETFREVFGPGSRAEVPVIGEIGAGEKAVQVSGQIDRLIVTPSEVFLVDYKTNRPPPDRVLDVPGQYVRQLAVYRALLGEIYPEHEIRCALLWTWTPELMVIPREMIDHAIVQLSVEVEQPAKG